MKRKIIGINSIRETLKVNAASIQFIAVKQAWEKSQELSQLVDLAKKKKVEIREWNKNKFEALGQGHQGVYCEVNGGPNFDLSNLSKKEHSLILALDGIEDPQNLGAMMRTAWLLEADCIVVPKDRSVKPGPTVNKVASGASEHLSVEVVSNLSQFLNSIKDDGYWVAGLAEEGKTALWSWEPAEKTVIVIGAEGKGLRDGIKKQCDILLNIWQTPRGSSYNASVAAALAMAEYRKRYLSK